MSLRLKAETLRLRNRGAAGMQSESITKNMSLSGGFKDTVKSIYSSVVGAYVLITLCVFPVFVTDMYFDILVDKYYFFLFTTICLAAVMVILGLVFIFIDGKENGGENTAEFLRGLKPKNLIKRLSLPDICVLIFFLVSGLSTICSEWLYEAFWGNMGRYSGFFLWIWYVFMYFAVTRFFKFKKIYLDAFILVGLYVCFWGIQDYFQLDPHGFLENVAAVDRDIFTSTIGNINTYTAWVAIYMAVASVLFVTEREGESSGEGSIESFLSEKTRIIISDVRLIFYLLSTCLFFTALIMGQSDNSVLSITALLCFMPFLAWRDRSGFIRYIIVLAAFAGSMWFTGAMSVKYADIVLPPDNGSMLISLSYKPFWKELCIGLLILAAAVIIINAIAAGKKKAETNARGGYLLGYRDTVRRPLPRLLRYIWLGLGIAALMILIWIFWDANHGGHPELYAPYRNILYFDINWGTHRGHNWGILMKHFSEFPIWKKLIGSGPETYGIVTRVYDYYEMKNTFGEIYDSAHNEYLQYLFTTGIIGLLSYLGWLITGVFLIFKKIRKRTWAFACGFAVIAYGFQAFVNITVPIVVPVFLLMLSMGLAAVRAESQEA